MASEQEQLSEDNQAPQQDGEGLQRVQKQSLPLVDLLTRCE